jgi:hypothetical protein
MGLRHGGRGHQVSRQTVRFRRRAGIKPRRGHNFDHRLRGERHLRTDARLAKVSVDYEAIISRLVRDHPDAEDLEQELWVRLLEGATEQECRRDLARLKQDVAVRQWRTVSLDAPMRGWQPPNHGPAGTPVTSLIDVIDEHGATYAGQAPLPPELSPEWFRPCRSCGRLAIGMRCISCYRQEGPTDEERARMARGQQRRWARIARVPHSPAAPAPRCARCGGERAIKAFVCRSCMFALGPTVVTRAKQRWWATHRGQPLPDGWPSREDYLALMDDVPGAEMLKAA